MTPEVIVLVTFHKLKQVVKREQIGIDSHYLDETVVSLWEIWDIWLSASYELNDSDILFLSGEQRIGVNNWYKMFKRQRKKEEELTHSQVTSDSSIFLLKSEGNKSKKWRWNFYIIKQTTSMVFPWPLMTLYMKFHLYLF